MTIKTKDLESKEKTCISHMSKKEYDAFKYLFNEIMHVYDSTKTKHSITVKACYLMILLAEDWQEYLYFLQTLDFEDISNSYIQFVLNIEILLAEENISILKREIGKIKEFDHCLKKIIESVDDAKNKRYQMEQLSVEDEKVVDPIESIKECLKFTKKFNKI